MASKPNSPSLSQDGETPPPVAKGPFFIFLVMMPAFIAVIVMLLVVMQYKQLKSFVAEKPMALTSLPESPEAQEKTLAKVRGFFPDPAAGLASAPETLSLSAEELNHLIRTSKALMDLHLDYHLDLQDTLLVARNSLPVSHLGGMLALVAKVFRVKGFLNSEMKGRPEFQDSKIVLVPVSAVMNNQPAPVSVLNSKGPIDPREWVADKVFYDQALAGLSDVKVREGRLLLIKAPKP